ncbi:hypothetical protein C5167_043900 [Papaver somniferum]|uniref:ER membrane protein complex subunit 2 n=1 Tax=Papaver somniferum TaxID=3469 RepID=A0A4Y7L711_PAPSO|nr:hypothetical protein C5167_043900 [Papaver somniferum]
MVGATEEVELNRLESQVDNGGGGDWKYLCLVRKLKVRRSDKVLKHGLSILNDSKKRSKLGGEEWTLYEQVAIAAMDCQRTDIAMDCVKVLQKKFPESLRVGRLEGMLVEAKGSYEDADNIYEGLLEDNPLDQVIHKRRIAMSKAQGNISEAITRLNKYLEISVVSVSDLWQIMMPGENLLKSMFHYKCEIPVKFHEYKQAAFCYEELILCQPTVPLYHLAYADVLYTIGGLENLQNAKKYYTSTIDLTGGKNIRALYGICLSSSAIGQLTKGRNKEEKEGTELQSLAATALEKDYKKRSSNKLPLLTATLKNLKL